MSQGEDLADRISQLERQLKEKDDAIRKLKEENHAILKTAISQSKKLVEMKMRLQVATEPYGRQDTTKS
ncbi:MAG: hypothetical protein ABIH41_01940 [Nanoarchaeota archaeon]